MAKRGGRYSAADRATPVIGELPRPEPPRQLSEEGKEVFRETVNAFKPDWFAGSESVLAAYCETVVLNRRLVGMISQCDVNDARWPELVRLYHADVATLVRLATCLRITPQSTRLPDRPKIDALRGERPWLDDDADLVEAGQVEGDDAKPN